MTVNGTARPIQRLADSAARPDPGAANRATRLVALPVPDGVLELSLQPARSLRLVEVALFRSVRALGRQPPDKSVECASTCGRWPTSISDERRTVRVPARDIKAGNVLVVASFVETASAVQQVSWGVVFHSPAAPG